jgi:hypothetical protein
MSFFFKVRHTQGAYLQITSHYICHHPSYAHTIAAVIHLNVFTKQCTISFPIEYCYVITHINKLPDVVEALLKAKGLYLAVPHKSG